MTVGELMQELDRHATDDEVLLVGVDDGETFSGWSVGQVIHKDAAIVLHAG